ncbi:MAG: hypothetical protein ABI724_04775 [Betaproteobacteria bacterium]
MIRTSNSFQASMTRGAGAGRERGVVLFIALLVMVALSLAGIALIRSADTATIVAGNLAFKQAAAAAVDRSVEQAVERLFNPQLDPNATTNPVIANKTVDLPSENYYACVQADGGGCLPVGTPIPEVPLILTTKTGITPVPADIAGNTSYYVIERMCANPGAAVGSNCNLSSAALGADAGTQHYEALNRVGDAFYRVSIRVDGPRNTVQYAQAIVK